jgi:hypothetical protein
VSQIQCSNQNAACVYHVHCRGLVVSSQRRARGRGREGKAEMAVRDEGKERQGKTGMEWVSKNGGVVFTG